MITINVNVTNKIATASSRVAIVCGNSDYQVRFTFDSEWETHITKTARFIWNGQFVDVAFTGDTCPVPIVSNTTAVKIGVYAGELTTTTPAHLDCLRSILCGGEKLHDKPSNGEAQVDAVRDAGAQALRDIDEARKEAAATFEGSAAGVINAALEEAKAGGEFDGADGKSAYEIAVEKGFEGTEEEWLESLKVGVEVEFATDEEVSDALEAIYGETSGDVPDNDNTIFDKDFATNDEVEDMLDGIFGEQN